MAPGLAPVAKQQGLYVAKLLRARAMGTSEPRPFRYRNWGMMAVIGRSRAVADFGRVKLSGFTAWLAWSLVHLMLLIDFQVGARSIFHGHTLGSRATGSPGW